MRKIAIGKERVEVPAIGLGCMRITERDRNEAEYLIKTAMENGINFFDHADIYANGEAEAFFAEAIQMNSGIREQIILQTKCSIRPGCCYDFSKQHILESVDSSLKRLKTDYVDFLLLHRPDTLMEPEEVAEAFNILERQGKVKYFGVSNQNSYQIELLNKYCENKISVNQLQFSLTNCGIIDSGINVNMENDYGKDVAGGILEYCRLKDITIQAWSPFQYGFFEGVFLNNEKFPELNKEIDRLAAKYEVENSAVAVGWILRHPAQIQTIVGTTNAKRLQDICKAADLGLTREEWYSLYMAAGKRLP
jgi:predicted oxidoreductase